jgi:hypothetical protein
MSDTGSKMSWRGRNPSSTQRAQPEHKKGSQQQLAPKNPTTNTTKEVKIMTTTIAPATSNLSEYYAAVDQPAPEGFAFNFQAFIECGVVSWAGPTASTADYRLNVTFEWNPAEGAYAELDLLPGDRYSVEQMRDLHAALGAALDALQPANKES